MLVKEYMTLNPRTVNPEDDGQNVAEKMESLNYSQFPVVEDKHTSGTCYSHPLG